MKWYGKQYDIQYWIAIIQTQEQCQLNLTESLVPLIKNIDDLNLHHDTMLYFGDYILYYNVQKKWI